MKKLMIIMALAALTATAGAQENDTVVIHNPKKVTIITGDSLQRIIAAARRATISSRTRTPSDWWTPTTLAPPASAATAGN